MSATRTAGPAIALAEGAAPPTEFRIFAAGTIATTKGVFLFDEEAAKLVMAKAADWGNEYPLDYDHAMVAGFVTDPAEAGKAAGWFRPEVRAGELWAVGVTWTPKAAAMLAAREYRYISPTFKTDPDGRITELLNVALTNLPATKDMEPIVASKGAPGSEEKSMDPKMMERLEAAIASLEKQCASLAKLAEAAAPPPCKEPDGDEAEEMTRLTKERDEVKANAAALAKEFADFKAGVEKKEREAIIASIKGDGKATPAMEKVLASMSLDQLKEFQASAPKIIPLGPGPGEKKPETTGEITLSEEDKKIAKLMGLSEADVLKTKKSMAGASA